MSMVTYVRILTRRTKASEKVRRGKNLTVKIVGKLALTNLTDHMSIAEIRVTGGINKPIQSSNDCSQMDAVANNTCIRAASKLTVATDELTMIASKQTIIVIRLNRKGHWQGQPFTVSLDREFWLRIVWNKVHRFAKRREVLHLANINKMKLTEPTPNKWWWFTPIGTLWSSR